VWLRPGAAKFPFDRQCGVVMLVVLMLMLMVVVVMEVVEVEQGARRTGGDLRCDDDDPAVRRR